MGILVKTFEENEIIVYHMNMLFLNKLMHFTINNKSPGSIQFMRNKLNVINKCTLLGVKILNKCSADIDHPVKQFNCKKDEYLFTM